MNQLNLPEFKGRGYSFEVLRAKVLFSTRATVKPKFGYLDFEETPGVYTFIAPTLLEGFGVSIPQLLEVIERDDF